MQTLIIVLNGDRIRKMRIPILQSISCIVLVFSLLLSGCATGGRQRSSKRPADVPERNVQIEDQLKLQRVTAGTIAAVPKNMVPKNVFIIVHPAYSFFLRDADKGKLSQAKYDLAKKQFDNEKEAITSQAAAGSVVILVLPGNYGVDSSDPISYVAYLNSMLDGGRQIYYVLSETSSTGTLPVNDMVSLHSFLQALKVNKAKVMIGGGYIGRCQREFYNQLTTYLDTSLADIVPEISTISPDDISDSEAEAISSRLQQQDFTPVKMFVDKKTKDSASVLSMPK